VNRKLKRDSNECGTGGTEVQLRFELLLTKGNHEVPFKGGTVMKRTIALAIVTATLILMGTVFGHAQAGTTEASIPFNFNVGSHALPAGIYKIKYVSPGAILIESQDKRFLAFSVFFEGSRPSSRSGHLVFAKYGDRYFLRQVLCAEVDLNAELPTSKLEKRVGIQEAHVPRNQTEVATLSSPEK
jgi:hypothetical protein